jgi:autotransporter-associated beta strand protein
VNILSGGGTIEVLGTSATATDLALTGSGPLTKIGNGTLQFAGVNASSYTGDFNVRRGTLELNKTAGVDAVGGGNLLIGFSSTVSEAATVRLLADNQINDATNVSVRSVATGALGTFDLNGHAETIGSLTVSAITGSGALVRTGAGGVLTLNGNITLSNDRNTNDTGTTARGVLITGTGTVGVAAPNSGTLDLGGGNRTITVEPNNLTVATTVGRPDATIETVIRNGAITKEGSRVLFLSANNTYAGSTTINNGTISISSSTNLGDGSATNTLAINNGGILQNTGANVDLGVTRAVSLGGSAAFLESTGSIGLTISGIISGTDCAALTVMGTGTVVLSGTNTYLGSTNILAGTLSISSEENLGTNPLIPNAAQLNINGGRLLTTADVILDDTNRGISVGAGNGTIETAAATTLTVENDLALAGNLTKAGPGRLILNGTTTGAGTFTASAGILQFGTRVSLYNNTPASWTAANITANTGATVAFNVGGTNELTAGNVTTLLTNLSTVNNNGLQSGSSVGFDTGNASGGSFTIADTITNSTGAGGGAVGVTKLGANTLILTGDNTYTGATNVDAGILEVNNTTGSGTGTGTVSVATGATLTGFGSIQGNTMIDSGATLSAGFDGVSDRTLSFSGDLTASAGSIWLVDLVQNMDGVTDHINVTGALNISGAIFQEGAFSSAFTIGNRYTIATYGSGLTGEFDLWANNSQRTISGGQYLINYADAGAITLTAVPEPGTLGFLGLALAGFLTRRIRKRRAVVAQVASASQE